METASPAGLCRGHCPDLSSIDRRQRALVYLAMVALPSCRVGRCPAHKEILDQENSRRAGVESLLSTPQDAMTLWILNSRFQLPTPTRDKLERVAFCADVTPLQNMLSFNP